jgi:hypothetical protein
MKIITADIRNSYTLNATEVILLVPSCSVAVTRYAAYWKAPSSSLGCDPHTMMDD